MRIELRGMNTDYSDNDLINAIMNLGSSSDRAKAITRMAGLRKLEMPIRWIRNGPATILFWKDGTKTIVKCNEEDKFDAQKGFLMACFERWTGMSKHQIGKLMEKVNDNEEWRSPYYFWR